MVRSVSRFRLTRSLWPSVFALLLFGSAGCRTGYGTYLYEGDEATGFLIVERLPDPTLVPMESQSSTIKTNTGTKELIRFCRGDCEDIFRELLRRSDNPERSRLVVETNDKSFYCILLEPTFTPTRETVAKVADALGLEITHGRRRKLAYLLGAPNQKPSGIEKFHGQPKWPALRSPQEGGPLTMSREVRKFSNGGVYVGDTDDRALYFDGISFDELAQYFEEARSTPVVNQCDDNGLYSFSLPIGIARQFSFERPVPLPGLGLSVSSGEVEMEVLLIREKTSKKATSVSND